jgi:hypothetical protein
VLAVCRLLSNVLGVCCLCVLCVLLCVLGVCMCWVCVECVLRLCVVVCVYSMIGPLLSGLSGYKQADDLRKDQQRVSGHNKPMYVIQTIQLLWRGGGAAEVTLRKHGADPQHAHCH